MKCHRLGLTVVSLCAIGLLGCPEPTKRKFDSGGAEGGSGGGGGGGGSGGGGRGGAGGMTGMGGAGGRDSGTSDARDGGGGVDATNWTMCPNPKPGVSAADFCSYYLMKCTFQADGGVRFMSMAHCTMRYGMYNATQQGCAAYHLCNAGMAGMAVTHCPHPAQTGGPCALP